MLPLVLPNHSVLHLTVSISLQSTIQVDLFLARSELFQCCRQVSSLVAISSTDHPIQVLFARHQRWIVVSGTVVEHHFVGHSMDEHHLMHRAKEPNTR